jgi:hypothetical protein
MRVEEKDVPRIEHPNDAIVRVGLAAICGSDLHLYRVARGTRCRAGACPGRRLRPLGQGFSVAGGLLGRAVVASAAWRFGPTRPCSARHVSKATAVRGRE